MIGHFAPGIEIPLRPFFGSMGLAGAGERLGARSHSLMQETWITRNWWQVLRSNIPVAAKGAMFEAGDGHAAREMGRWTHRMETFLTGTFNL